MSTLTVSVIAVTISFIVVAYFGYRNERQDSKNHKES